MAHLIQMTKYGAESAPSPALLWLSGSPSYRQGVEGPVKKNVMQYKKMGEGGLQLSNSARTSMAGLRWTRIIQTTIRDS